ncbi:aldehyde dehydrogenase (NADP(+)) [uncultured Draconibacterium sp.]|uniref:aldehyde dehydrogenase (NADP(+)) n=1 Tax=uncultured Draconibacterium sp. TaxID=1573823 RepID=UPI0029C7C1BF|nr:aldehyde dehydrogenase (NADP(+)) [uncultured Draconibacterium sp.]
MAELKDQINEIMLKASEAFNVFKKVSAEKRAVFLRTIGEEIMNIGDELVETVMAESNLPVARVRGERGRTVGQLNKFADLIDEGSWCEATIDVGDPGREPLPKPDIRKKLVPLGPVVVFGAGNFPLAFSVAGGDTASALAGGNPVVVKGHPAHPKTGALVAAAINKAVEKCELPAGTFGFIDDASYESGQLLVKHPVTKAVGFTGSYQGGMALVKLAAEREEPIPVFAEMGSVNPVVVMEEALAKDHAAIASKLVASVNLGAGQFCTNPGLLITTKTEGYEAFVEELAKEVAATKGSQMFSTSVLRNYELNKDKIFSHSEVKLLGTGIGEEETGNVPPALATVSGADFIKNPHLHEEVFGPFSLLVVCENKAELLAVVNGLKGQLTATVHAKESELPKNQEIVDALLVKCGRLLLNGVPTGVEVCAAMQHGGPFPAASDSRFTSVGVSAIKRFVRPVAYQDFPDSLLPAELQNSNPLKIWRVVNDTWTNAAVK